MMESGTHQPAPAYWAFISYSSKDRATARWLHRRIENYAIPKEFQSISFPDGTPLGKHLRPVFRDRDELSGSADLGPAISRALAQSRYLIVLCSRNSAQSTWVNKEILEFQAAGKERNILALILDGEPNATSNPSVPDEDECFPPALRYPVEPLAGDFRKTGDGPERGFLKVLAGMAQLDFDGLYRRHERAQRRRRLVIGSLAAMIIVALTSLSWFALVKKKEADSQRETAEREKGRAMRNEQEAKQQTQLAKKRLADSFFATGSTRIAAGEEPSGIRDLMASLSVDPSHSLAKQRLYDHLANHNYALPVSSKVRFAAEQNNEDEMGAQLLGTSPGGNLLLRQGTTILECTQNGGKIVAKDVLKIAAKTVQFALYHEPSRQLAVCLVPEGERRVGRLTVLRQEGEKWLPVLDEEVGPHDRMQFSQDGNFLYLANYRQQFLWNLKTAKPVMPPRTFPGAETGMVSYSGISFGSRSKHAILSIRNRATLVDLNSGSCHQIPLDIEELNQPSPMMYLRDSDPLILIAGKDGIRAIKAGVNADGTLSGTFEDWGVMEESEGTGIQKNSMLLPLWVPLPDECLAVSSNFGQHSILGTRRLSKAKTLSNAYLRTERQSRSMSYHPEKSRVSADTRFLLHRGSPTIIYDLQQLRQICMPLETNSEIADLCWVGSDGRFAVLDRFQDLQFFEAEGTGVPGASGQELGALNLTDIASWGKKLMLDPQAPRPGPCVVWGYEGKQHVLTCDGLEKVSDARFLDDGAKLIAGFVEPMRGEKSRLAVFNTSELKAAPTVISEGPFDEILDLPSAMLVAVNYPHEKRTELTDTSNLKHFASLPDCENPFGVDRWMDIADDRSRAMWRVNDHTVAICILVNGEARDVKQQSFAEDVKFVELSQSGIWAGVVLKSGKIALWKTDSGQEVQSYHASAQDSGGIVFDERNACLHVVTNDQTIDSYDLASGALVGSMPIDFPAMKIEVARTADLLKVSRYPSPERPAAINACNWSFACPADVQARDLVALGTAVTGWRWDPENLIMRPGETFTPETENLLDRMSAARTAGRLRIPKPDDGGNKLDFASVEFLAASNQLVLLGDRPKGHIFSPVVRAYEGLKLLMNEKSSRKETATLAARNMPPPGDVEVAGEALVYAMLHAALEDRGKAESYLARTKDLGGMEKFPDPIRAIESGLKEP